MHKISRRNRDEKMGRTWMKNRKDLEEKSGGTWMKNRKELG
jgi:hypothetical protein